MKSRTFFFIRFDGKVFRKDTNSEIKYPFLDGGYRLAASSDQVIELTDIGTGRLLKNRYGSDNESLTREEMIFLSLQAENI